MYSYLRAHSYLDVNDVADLVGGEVLVQRQGSVVAEAAREHVPRAAAVAVRVTHFFLGL